MTLFIILWHFHSCLPWSAEWYTCNYNRNVVFLLGGTKITKQFKSGVLGGDLHYHLSQHGVFSEKEMRFYAAEIILGLEHMHNRFVVYRDLKVRTAVLLLLMFRETSWPVLFIWPREDTCHVIVKCWNEGGRGVKKKIEWHRKMELVD